MPASALAADGVVAKLRYRVKLVEQGMFSYGPLETAPPVLTPDGAHLLVGTSGGQVVKVDVASGEVVYTRPVAGGVAAAPLLAGESLFVGTQEGTVHRLALADGRPEWKEPARIRGAVRSAPVLWSDGLLVVEDDASVLYAIDATNGTLLADYSGQSFARRGLSPFTIYGYPELLVGPAGELYAGFETGYVLRFAAPKTPFAGFEVAWEQGPCRQGALDRQAREGAAPLCSPRRTFRDVDTSPVWYEESVLSGCYCGGFMRFSASDGLTRWETPILGPSAPLVLGDTAYVASAAGAVHGVRLADGKLAWTTRADISFLTPPVAVGGQADPSLATLVVATGSELLFLAAQDGQPLLRLEAQGGVAAPPVAAGNALFVFSNEGYLYRLDYFR